MQEPISYWDDSFRQRLESKTISEGLLLWALSGPSFALRTAQAMIYLDPFLGIGGPVLFRASAVPLNPRRITLADGVLMSHDHLDHCHEPTLRALAAGTPARFFGPASVVEKVLSFGLPRERVVEVKVGERFTLGDTVITVWPGYDPGEPRAVSFVIESGGVKAFFAGDSLSGPALDEIGAAGGLDIAMMAFGRTWYMSEAELLDAALRLRPRLLLPYHWEIWYGHTGDPLKLGRLIEQRKPPFEVEALLLGECLHYRRDGQYTRE